MDNDRDLLLEPLLGQFEACDEKAPFEDELICECHVVGLFHLRDLALEAGKVDLILLQEKTGLGTGCGSCLKCSGTWLAKLESCLSE